MKTKLFLWALPLFALGIVISLHDNDSKYQQVKRTLEPIEGCVFMTLMGEQSSKDFNVFMSSENVQLSVRDGLSWLQEAQLPSGGYGAGSHTAQHVRDPHAVSADPATTAMVAQAFLRSGITLKHPQYGNNLKAAIDYLLEVVESTEKDAAYISTVRGTQIQTKLGENIDAVLTAQLLSNLLDRNLKGVDKKRVTRCLDICVSKIEMGADATGKQKGAGWAGVLQSGLALSALESAEAVGVEVEEDVLERSKKYQKGNYDASNKSVNTEDGAGIMLYAISNSVRASAKDARIVQEAFEKAKKKGIIDSKAEVTVDNLKKLGYTSTEAMEYNTSYQVYQSGKNRAQDEEVLNGFGNNGGEEFLSFLQTGESMVVNNDDAWKDWYESMSGRILKIQNEDGSWNGHHCITSPVFCTATSLLLLTVENDLEFLSKVGE